jgi:phage FluMu protein Com
MEKTIKVLALTTTQQLLISEVSEVAAVDIGQPDCKLINPFVINTESGQTVLEPWLFNITRDDTFMMSSDKILTLCEPTPTLLEKYLDITKE